MSETALAAAKTLDDNFRDWEGGAFGYGYGSGEPHTLAALKAFLAAIPERQYDYQALETAVSPPVAWLLINRLCQINAIEYGTSPRYGWLTAQGQALKAYCDHHTAEELYAIVCGPAADYVECYPDHCNCDGPTCSNPFWGAPS